VRGELHGFTPPVYRGYVIRRGILNQAYAGHEDGKASETLGRGLRFGLFGTGADRSYWYACESGPEGSPDYPGGAAAGLRERFGRWPEPIASVVAAIDETAVLRNDAFDRPPLRLWGRGRATLLGDAAHPTTPNLGQGACLALEDALVVARCLDRESGSVAEALARYEALRRGRTAAIVFHSRWLGAMGQWRSPWAVAVRNTLGRFTPDGLASGAAGLPTRFRA
jgi:2-polyprenyl-6-methoxyphenol hydroxylase-like FAD-dependent oxidoreductase